jgi:hypothetical protein
MNTMPKTKTGSAVRVAGLLLLALGASAPTPASALDFGPREPAFRLGVSLQPDQLHVGFGVALGPPQRVRLRPSLDFGAGNGVRILSLNGDVVVRLGRPDARFRFFLGGGPALNLVDVTSGVGEARGVEAKLVGHALAGIARTRPLWVTERLYLEVRAGFGDTPDVKVTAGVWF